MSDAFQQTGFQLTPLAFQIDAIGSPVWPDPEDVRQGVVYGPTGVEYVGTMTPSAGGGIVWMRRR